MKKKKITVILNPYIRANEGNNSQYRKIKAKKEDLMNEKKNSSFGFWQEKNVSKWILCAWAYNFFCPAKKV